MVSQTPVVHHIALTVRSFEVSIPWYEQVFGLTFRKEAPHDGGVGRFLSDDENRLVIVLHEHDANDGGVFSERATGLDHVGFGSAEGLETWQVRLEAAGVVRADAADRPLTQSPIAEIPSGRVLVFRDPDNIQLELFAPPAT